MTWACRKCRTAHPEDDDQTYIFGLAFCGRCREDWIKLYNLTFDLWLGRRTYPVSTEAQEEGAT